MSHHAKATGATAAKGLTSIPSAATERQLAVAARFGNTQFGRAKWQVYPFG
jgi:hypothetical protein